MSDHRNITVQFEPTGWRTLGEGEARKSLPHALEHGAIMAEAFAAQVGGSVVPRDPSHGQYVRMTIPADAVQTLAAQPFVGREYPDQIRTTLHIVPA